MIITGRLATAKLLLRGDARKRPSLAAKSVRGSTDRFRGLQVEHRYLRPNAEADTEAKADPLVHIEQTVAIRVKPRGITAAVRPERDAAQTRKVDLSAVGVAAEHQVAAMAAESLDGARVVREHDARRRRCEVGEGALGIAHAAPQILDTGEIQLAVVALQDMGFVLQHADTMTNERLGDGPVQMAITANAQSVAHGKVMIAENGEDAKRTVQVPEDAGNTLDVLEAFMDEVASEDDNVGLLLVREFDRFLQVSGGDLTAPMKVGHLRDTQTGERGRQIGDGDVVVIDLEPGRLDVNRIGKAGPVASDPASEAILPGLRACLGAEPVDQMIDHEVCLSWGSRPNGRAGNPDLLHNPGQKKTPASRELAGGIIERKAGW